MNRLGRVVFSVIAVGVALFCGLVTRAAVRADDEPAARKLALLVGVKVYEHPEFRKLDFPEADVEELGGVLTGQGFDVTVMTTARARANAELKPTAAGIRRQLQQILKRASKQDLMIVGLSGHGLQPLEYKDSFYCPTDAVPVLDKGKLTDPDSLISIQEVLTTLRRSKVGLKLLLVDACRNDPSIKGSKGVDDVSIEALPPQTGVMLSCSPGEFSFEHPSLGMGHGAFFYYITEGMRGEAKDADGHVTWENLRGYVRTHVPDKIKELYGKDGGEQNPNEIGNLRGRPAVLAIVRVEKEPREPNGTKGPDSPPTDPDGKIVTAEAFLSHSRLPAGKTCEICVQLKIKNGWWIHAGPGITKERALGTELKLVSKNGTTLSDVKYESGRSKFDGIQNVMVYEGQTTIRGTLTIPAAVSRKSEELRLQVSYQANSDLVSRVPTRIVLLEEIDVAAPDDLVNRVNKQFFPTSD